MTEPAFEHDLAHHLRASQSEHTRNAIRLCGIKQFSNDCRK